MFWKRRLQFDLLTEVACKGRGRIGFCSSKREKDKRLVRCYSHFLDEMAGPKLIACVGDVHGFWNKESEDALCWLRPDLSLFVGDFGEEDVELVRQIADVRDRKAVILGNHDGWHSTSGKGSMEGVEKQLDLLGDDHVGLSANSYPDLGLSVVGCRPFSAGGGSWRRFSKFYKRMYGLRNFQDSTTQIVASALAEPQHHNLIFLAHNGPSGLGEQADSICGIDWKLGEQGDMGDMDLHEAIDDVSSRGRSLPLVVFGHMHEMLHRNAFPRVKRNMFHLDEKRNIAYVNCAVVPRIRRAQVGENEENGGSGGEASAPRQQHNFVLIELEEGKVQRVESIWIERNKEEGEGAFHIAERTEWYCLKQSTCKQLDC